MGGRGAGFGIFLGLLAVFFAIWIFRGGYEFGSWLRAKQTEHAGAKSGEQVNEVKEDAEPQSP